ncbi:SMI1/KNR4 family protein [Actinomadura rupiterrae]|uniref:SMI1/KNR4 family protein n=1 Tax=Actinomadura rupiterrae TaxID=559627 RepID=UPI0020A4B085|nr:SMI1/KNR4 family protein [Actinomadura rupiterrae]MCP2336703.1 cell wall assembly regulator SMI1 [Actinomadura rupiterrae]
MPALDDFATWEPLLRLMWEALDTPNGDGKASGSISKGGWSVPVKRPPMVPGRAMQVEDMRAEHDAVERVMGALGEPGVISFVAEFEASGRTVLRLINPTEAAQPGLSNAAPDELVLVAGSRPEPWRRLPEPNPDAVPAPTADAALVERTLRERLPDAIAATDEEIAAAEARLGMPLPDELKAVYRVTRARWSDFNGDYEAMTRHADAVRAELYSLDSLRIADAASRDAPWQFAATEAAVTRPDSAVQGLPGSPGWLAFGENGGGDVYAIDLTPGPAGRLGQIIFLSHEENIGAALVADSLTDMIVHDAEPVWAQPADGTPEIAYVNVRSIPDVASAAHPDLEVLSLGVWEAEPTSLAPVFGCPKLRTLSAYPGTLADPLEINRLANLEYLSLPVAYWRVLLDADAVPRSLLAAGFEGYADDPLDRVAVANELLALFAAGPQITETVVEGVL